MRNAFKKCRNLTEENKKKEIKINQLEDSLKVSDVVFRGIINKGNSARSHICMLLT